MARKQEIQDHRTLPRKGDKIRDKRLALRVPSDDVEKWRKLAEKDNRSLSDFLYLTLKKHLG